MTASPVINFAVVGLGLMGERHCRVIRAVSGANLAGVCDSSPALAEAIAARHETRAFASFDEMLASPSVDAIVICLPSALHADHGICAAIADKHVIVEKPIDSDLVMAERLVRECEARELICAPISQYRYGAGLQALKWAVESGTMGQPVLARASVRWFRHDEYYTQSHWRGRRAGENGGVLINQAVHAVDTLQWIFNEPEAVSGYIHGSRPQVMETEDTAVVLFRWKTGLLAALEASTSAAPGFDETYEISSPTASIKVEKDKVTHWWHRDGVDLPDFQSNSEQHLEHRAGNETHALEPKLQLFARQYQNIIAAIRGEANLDVLPEQAIATLRTISKIYLASEAGP